MSTKANADFSGWDAKFAAKSAKEPERVNSDKQLIRELERWVEELKGELSACKASPQNTTAREKKLLEKLETCQKMKKGIKKGSAKAIAAADRQVEKRKSSKGKRRKKKYAKMGTTGRITYSGRKRSKKGEGQFGALNSLGEALKKARNAAKRTGKKVVSAVAEAPKAAAKAAKKVAKAATGSSPKKKGRKSKDRVDQKDPTFRGGSAAQNRKAIKEAKQGKRNPNTGRLYSDPKKKG
jgi:DNA-binding protein HU-beta